MKFVIWKRFHVLIDILNRFELANDWVDPTIFGVQ
jgi:hypothetical protein